MGDQWTNGPPASTHPKSESLGKKEIVHRELPADAGTEETKADESKNTGEGLDDGVVEFGS